MSTKYVSAWDGNAAERVANYHKAGMLVFVLLDSPRGHCPMSKLCGLRLGDVQYDEDSLAGAVPGPEDAVSGVAADPHGISRGVSGFAARPKGRVVLYCRSAGWVAGWEAAMGTGAKPPLRRRLRCP